MKILLIKLKLLFSGDGAGPSKSSRGDTIVEVMMSLVVLSMILTTVYALSSRSLRAGTEANQRTEALNYAQSQVDLLINAKNTDPNFATNYQVSQPFCLNTDGTKNTAAQATTNKLCNSYNGSQYNVGVSYNNNLFTVTAQWDNPDAPNGTANLNLYYKLPGVYKKALVTAGTGSAAGTSATINGTVNPNGNVITDCYFNYDTTTNYTQPKKVSCSSLPGGSGTTDIAVTATISNLDPDTIYYFQLCATNLVGTSCSVNNGTFTTPARPTISNEGANNTVSASGNTADLVAQVNPNGTDTTCVFEWGLTTAYGANGSPKNCGGSIGAGTTPVPVTAKAASLSVGQTYHFRVVATNAAGTTTGTDHTFVTSLPAKPTVTLTADSGSNTIAYNSGTTLRWTSTNATSCTGNGFSTGGTSPVSGNAPTGNLLVTTSYSVTCSGAGGTTTSSPATTVLVGSPPPPPPPPPLAWLCGNFWNNGYTCAGPFGPGDYGWVEQYGVQNDNLSWVNLQNTTIALYAGIYFNTYDGGGGVCITLSTSSWTPVSLWASNMGGTSSFKVGVGC